MTDEIDVLRALQPRPEPADAAFLNDKRSELMATITGELKIERSVRRPNRRRRRVWVVPVAALVAAGAGATAWAVVWRDPARTMTIACGQEGFVNAASGDPVADCADWWRREKGGEPPKLVPYRTDSGIVGVLPESQQVPRGWTRLADGFRQDGRLAQLDRSLNDINDGLSSGCHSLADATPVAERVLRDLGLTAWVVESERAAADGRQACTFYYIDSDRYRVVLIPRGLGPGGDGLDGPRALAKTLATRLRDACVPLDQAMAIARQEATTVGLTEGPSGSAIIHPVTDPTVTCSSSTVNVGGLIEVTVRGPAGG